MEKKKPPTPPEDRHLKEGELPKYRLIKETDRSGLDVYYVQKRVLWFWISISAPTINEGAATNTFRSFMMNLKCARTIIDQV